ncbi:hypothetical protein HK102_009604 [Quaeritorhiza haematococci]|nr:hypothetical protein HK102_009604 [Quaeritorhiza haematococci]
MHAAVSNGTSSELSAASANILWAVFAWMTASSVVYFALALRQAPENRVFHYLTLAITTIAALSYYAMASNEGYVTVNDRRIYYARYIDWTFTTPLLLADLGMLAGLGVEKLLWIAFMDVLMVVTGVFGAIDATSAKWGWFVFGCVFFVPILYALVVDGNQVAASKSEGHRSVYTTLSILTIVLWTAYPIVWALAEGTQVLSLDAEIGIYAVLDITAKSIFGFYLLLNHHKLDEFSNGK